MGIARSRIKKVAPVSVTEESVCSGDEHLLGPSDTSLFRIVSLRKKDRTDCNSERKESAVSAEYDTFAEVDRILAERENYDERLNSRNSQKMSTLKSSGLCSAQPHANIDIDRDSKHKLQHCVCEKNEVNTMNKPSSDTFIHKLNTDGCHGTGGISTLAFPVTYDASEEDLMDTIEREFGQRT